MYKNLIKAMIEKDVHVSEIATTAGITVFAVLQKLYGYEEFSLAQAKRVKVALFPDQKIDDLFEFSAGDRGDKKLN